MHRELERQAPLLRERIEEIVSGMRASGIAIPARIEQLALTPAVLTQQSAAQTEQVLRAVLERVRWLVEARFGCDLRRLADYLQPSEWMPEINRCDVEMLRAGWNLAARPDAVLSPHGLRILEMNLVPLFGHQTHDDVVFRAISSLPTVRRILRRRQCIYPNSLDAFASA
ncbi:hypothetical protein [Gaiella occulta]|uniref:hypothetical protein n=1 Tax=Gaiella occulta TaxID=1002870 RepID=UPI000E0A4D78|nr:hypothetical protein [Gaiella occulta]